MPGYASACLRILREGGAGPVKQGRWLSMYALARFPRLRRPGGSSRAGAQRRENEGVAPLEAFAEDAALREVDRRGFAQGLRLGPRALLAIRGLAQERESRGALHPLAPTVESAGDSVVACYEDTASWPPVAAVASHLHPLARRALGRGSTFLGSRVWWSFPRTGSDSDEIQTGRRFHFDLYAWRSLSCFFYLTDVDEDAGPHVCVLGSHRRKALRHQFSARRWREDAEIESAYGRSNLRTMIGPAGTGFLEDPACFHKAVPPAHSARLILQLLWGSEDFVAPGFSREFSGKADGEASGSDTGSAASPRAT